LLLLLLCKRKPVILDALPLAQLGSADIYGCMSHARLKRAEQRKHDSYIYIYIFMYSYEYIYIYTYVYVFIYIYMYMSHMNMYICIFNVDMVSLMETVIDIWCLQFLSCFAIKVDVVLDNE
jgi:hypothetical protein